MVGSGRSGRLVFVAMSLLMSLAGSCATSGLKPRRPPTEQHNAPAHTGAPQRPTAATTTAPRLLASAHPAGSLPVVGAEIGLAPNTNFGAFVQMLRQPHEPLRPAARCMLRGGAGSAAPAWFAAPLRPAVRLLPKVASLAATVRGARAPVVVTPHGTFGDLGAPPEARVSFVSLTPVSAGFGLNAVAVVLLADEHRVYAGMAGREIAFPLARVTAAGRQHLLGEVIANAQYAVVALTADTSITRWREVFGWFQHSSAELVLALATRDPVVARAGQPPRRDALAQPGVHRGPELCPRGLGAVPVGKKAGDLGVDGFARAREGLTVAAQQQCGSTLTAQQSGTMHLWVQLTGARKPAKVCLSKDFVGSQAARQCVLQVARAYPFPKLRRSGVANVRFAVLLTLPFTRYQPLCDP